MIQFIEFFNYKALRNTKLELSPFTLLLGPNGSGKSSVLQALKGLASLAQQQVKTGGLLSNVGWRPKRSVSMGDKCTGVDINTSVRLEGRIFSVSFRWIWNGGKVEVRRIVRSEAGEAVPSTEADTVLQWLSRIQCFALDASAIAAAAPITMKAALESSGKNLAAVLDELGDNHHERWDSFVAEMRRWLPEYDNIFFDTSDGKKAIALQTAKGHHRLPAQELSQGTLIALALLTLAYLPNPPSLIALEEIDRGLHPRLLRHLQDALYRLAYPESGRENRPPIQVIATTHSPYLLDLYREHPEEVVLAEKAGLEVQMRRLADIEHFKEILGESPLSDVWYSGVFGGVAVKP